MIDAITSCARQLAKQRRFDRLLRELAAELAGWTIRADVQRIARVCMEQLEARQPGPLRKGAPDLLALKQQWGRTLSALLREPRVTAFAVALAEKIAGVAPLDGDARRLALAVFYLRYGEPIACLRGKPAPYLALHMSCAPRLDRAEASERSFDGIPTDRLSHLKLIGNEEDYRMAADGGLLEVPAADNYDHLPSKLIDAFALLAFAPNIQAVIKMDDDHRMGDPAKLLELLAFTARQRAATQVGQLYHCAYPAGHSHGWHWGKCREPEFAEVPFGYPAPLSWSTGEFGYILNRPALMRMLWARLYYRKWVRAVLYEDIAIGEQADKLGIRKHTKPIEQVLRFHGSY